MTPTGIYSAMKILLDGNKASERHTAKLVPGSSIVVVKPMC
jgi:hypothetical protein